MPHHNRWGGFKSLRQCWADHIASSLARPILIIDEAQEMITNAFNELRILSSERFDSRALLCIVFAGDQRLPERLRHQDLLPLGTRIRRRLHLRHAERDLLTACLDHLIETAGNPTLMTTELKTTLAEHAAGNFRILMNLADELLTVALDRELAQLDEGLFFDVFHQPAPAPAKAKSGRRRKR